ncbi:MAG TPA: TadE/TadG family type IV pilus assembly protein [Bryobacteraceae bacterium]|jgi:Flp pilus assembly protein TadG|nr:TadE/TadG family type IV pilus assembly protein [Bryobacteraceae bacterium]
MRILKAEDGSEIVEFSLIILPLFGLIFLILAVGWVVFAKASLQYAVREGVRYAVTNQSTPNIQALVQQQSFGFLAGDAGLSKISVNYYTPNNLQQTNSNQGGNLVEVSVSGVTVDPFGLKYFGLTPVTLSADSSDVMESAPPTS